MRSKTSFFNPTLFKKDLARFWPLWGGASALGALIPLMLLMELVDEGFRSHAGQGLEVTLNYYVAVADLVPVISLFYAALCALAVWHYLYNARSVGLLHSLPITRKGLFVTNFLAGLCMMLIPYAIVGGLLVLITLAAGLFEPAGVLVTILAVIGESFFYFAAATLIVFVTGNPFAFAAFYFIFHFLAAGAEWLVGELASESYLGVAQTYQGVMMALSPTLFLPYKLKILPVYEEIETLDGWIDRGVLQSVALHGGWLIAVYALVGVVLLGCAWALYRRRRSESAGEVVAVGWMKPIFRYGVALCAALAGGVLLYALLFATFLHAQTARAVPMAVCMAAAGVVGYYIASMLLAKSLRVFRGSGKGALATVLAAAAVCAFISADPFGVERWVPEAGELESVEISFYGTSGGYLNAKSANEATVRKVLALHQAILDDRDLLDDQDSALWESAYSGQVVLGYRMADGKRVDRYYPLPGSKEAMEQLASLREAVALATDPGIQEANIFQQILWEDITSARLTGGYIGDVYDTQSRQISGLDLTLDQAKALEAAVKRDIQAGHFGKTLFITDEEERDRLIYFGSFQLNYNVTYAPEDAGLYRGDSTARDVSFDISAYCTETLEALEDIGVLDGGHKLLTQEEYYVMRRQDDGDWDYYGGSYPDYAGSVYPEDAIVYPETMEAGSVGMVG